MAQISVNNLTFCYEGSFDNIFEKVSFSVDTNWKLGFIGRNGKGKTTFLNLLLGKYSYQGNIIATNTFDYFPYDISGENMSRCAVDFMYEIKQNSELWKVICELDKLNVEEEVLYRPYRTLSHGERTKVMLAILFSGENDFLLIDEPTNHLDKESREIVKAYLQQKKSFILVSHDRDLLDACVDHVLVLNRNSIEVQSGNFSSWWDNKYRKDLCAVRENEKHKKEINKLKVASRRASSWAEKSEGRKIGYDPIKENDRSIATRSYIGTKTKKMQKRVKKLNARIDKEIADKEGLLQDIEEMVDIKVNPLKHHKNVLCSMKDFGLKYKDADKSLFENLDMQICQNDRIFLNGANGCGKSSLIKVILKHMLKEDISELNIEESGIIETASGIIVSYVNQDTSFLKGNIADYCIKNGIDRSLFCALLRQLDMERVQFTKNMEDFSEGQKKKVLIASSLSIPAHIYIWDEPLNYIDVYARMQIEKLILEYKPTMLLVEHDVRFREEIATKQIEMNQ